MKTKNLHVTAAFLVSLCLIHCGSDAPGTFAKRTLVCQTEGFCLTHNDGEYFYGAFRHNDSELQFKVHYLHWSPTKLLIGGDRYAGCLMTDAQDEVYYGGVKCSEDPANDNMSTPQDYKKLAEEFSLYLENTSHTPGRKGEWEELKKMVRSFATHV